MDIIAILIDEHDRMKVALTALMDAEHPSLRWRTRIFTGLLGDLKRHTAYEQAHIYALLSERRCPGMAFQAQAEHQQIAFWLEELDRMPGDDPRWMAQVGVLANDLAQHLRLEEERLFPLLRRMVRREELVALGREYRARKAAAAGRRPSLAVAAG